MYNTLYLHTNFFLDSVILKNNYAIIREIATFADYSLETPENSGYHPEGIGDLLGKNLKISETFRTKLYLFL
jgi:hypothetical protein